MGILTNGSVIYREKHKSNCYFVRRKLQIDSMKSILIAVILLFAGASAEDSCENYPDEFLVRKFVLS